MIKIYSDDRLVPYKNTKIEPLTTRAEIDGLLARWGIKKTGWEWEPENAKIVVFFNLPDSFEPGKYPGVKFEPPAIWKRKTRNHEEEIDLKVSMRVLYWFLKSFLESIYLMQFDKTKAFLPFIVTTGGKTIADVIMPRLSHISEFEALPSETEEKAQLRKIIDPEAQ